jgi:ribonuclease HII
LIIGADEVGLGALAGPVVTAAVVLPKDMSFDGLRDSKKVTPANREWLSVLIKEQALGWVIAGSDSTLVDRHGVSVCRWHCMAACANECLKRYPEALVIVDGNQTIPGVLRNSQRAIVKADDKYQAVSAASVIAKVHRDHMMVKLWEKFPYYDWKKNAGYGTRLHIQAMNKYGLSPHHRVSYSPCAKVLSKERNR